MALNTKAWGTRLTEIKATVRGTTAPYRTALLQQMDSKLKAKSDDQKKVLSNSLHLSKQKTKAWRDKVRAIGLIEALFMPNPRDFTSIIAAHTNDADYLVLSELNRLIKSLDPANPNPPDLARHRPLKIGCSISGGNHAGPGSIACFVKCKDTGDIMILGNEHVMRAEFGTSTNDPPEIYQQSRGNGGTEAIATYTRGLLNSRVDAAVATLKPNVQWFNMTPEGTAVRSICTRFKKNDLVWKRGTASRETQGQIVDAKANKSVPHAKFGGTINFADQIEVKVTGPKTEFQIPGDSGSALFNKNNEIIGLMHGGGKDGGGIATPIERVFELLNIKLP